MLEHATAWFLPSILKEPGSSSTSPSRLPRMFVENQPVMPSMRAFKPGAISVFMNVCPVLKSLPQIGRFRSFASSSSAGVSVVRFGAPFAIWNPAFQRGVRIDLAGRNLRIVLA